MGEPPIKAKYYCDVHRTVHSHLCVHNMNPLHPAPNVSGHNRAKNVHTPMWLKIWFALYSAVTWLSAEPATGTSSYLHPFAASFFCLLCLILYISRHHRRQNFERRWQRQARSMNGGNKRWRLNFG